MEEEDMTALTGHNVSLTVIITNPCHHAPPMASEENAQICNLSLPRLQTTPDVSKAGNLAKPLNILCAAGKE